MRRSVYLLRPPEPANLAHLQARLHPDVELLLGPELPQPAAYHIVVDGRPRREHLAASPDLQAVIVPWAGIPPATLALLREFPHLALHNLHYNAVAVAEMAVALLLAAAKCIVPVDRALRAHDWSPRYRTEPPRLLAGQTALVLGYGEIGRRVAAICRGLDMRVLATRRHPIDLPPDCPDEVHPPDALLRLLPRSDALLVCLPHTAETDGLLGERELALLPSHAVLVNIGRGAIVDEGALYRALRDGALYAAGLDVWYNYPPDEASRTHTPPSAYPFHELDNVVLSPHRAGGSPEGGRLRMENLADLLNAAAQGEEMANWVDVTVGY